MLRSLRLVPLAMLMAAPAFGQEQGIPAGSRPNPNQALANAVARELEASAALKQMQIQVWCQSGHVELRGNVGDVRQREEAERIARKVPGVKSVANRLGLANAGVVPAQFAADAGELMAPPPAEGRPIQEPLPSYRVAQPPAMPGAELPAPMPPYAWPSYAPYNNFSRVAYPVVYPKEAFPLIGPVYPFPKTPLSWRKVTLEYDDGHWWLQTHATKRDWWVLRYW
ncbi:MAG: BON domain-containing protein [Gemmatales bacterium]|nr:BON domain-containing protein [Gemmatales bacterium]MDW8388285.1 BON domain-containing protein [Gemmatales bacterium]